MARELHYKTGTPIVGLLAQVVTADAAGTEVDQGTTQSTTWHVGLGAPGDTLSGTVYFEFVLYEGNTSGSLSAVTDANHVIGATPASGVVLTVDADAEASQTYKITYVGPYRYCRMAVDVTGTHTNGTPLHITAIPNLPQAQG